MPRPITSNEASTRWAIRIIPFFIAGAFGFATYAVIPHICVDYLYREKHKSGVAITLIVLYLVFFLLTVASYLRTYLACKFSPGLVPLSAARKTEERYRQKAKGGRGRDIEQAPWQPPDSNPDSPGLEAFYSKDVFVCELDGRPKWCSDCRSWKPDRARHSSEINRCIRKMDHICPWVGGAVSETSFNFFAQFTFYCCLYCATCIAASSYALHLQSKEDGPLDGRTVGVLVLGSFFALFSFAMTMTAVRFVATNTTNIDLLRKDQTYRLAIRIPQNTPPSTKYNTITYPLSLPPSEQSSTSINPILSADAMSSASLRDAQAKQKFAILTTEAGENPWDLGMWENAKSVMGSSPLTWLLPIWHSPCCNHDSMRSDYEFGPLIETMKRRSGIVEGGNAVPDGIEMRSADVSRF